MIHETDGWKASRLGKSEELTTYQKPYELELHGSEVGSLRPSWLRRMSTLSLFHQGSPNSTPRPSTPSISFSNSSSAPILLSTNAMTIPIASRNKLVKRSSSQRVLQSGYLNNQHPSRSQIPTFRRPATSHQRSATFQQQYMQSDSSNSEDFTKRYQNELNQEQTQWADESSQKWYPFFQSHHSRMLRETPPKKRDLVGSSSNDESIKCVSIDQGNLPTLLMATSIHAKTPESTVQDGASRNSDPSTPVRKLPQLSSTTTPNSQPSSSVGDEQKPRNSFSISELFASPSPSTWKISRTGSLRRKKVPENVVSSRRIVSEPNPPKGRQKAGRIKKSPVTKLPKARPLGSTTLSQNTDLEQSSIRSMSSPLPPLDQFSAFEVDLPDMVPSYPNSPILNTTPPSNLRKSSMPLSTSNSSSHYISKAKYHRPSGAPSDRASTVGGSDNENSRLFWGDSDEVDYQSETVYDSIRTGATGSSHSGAKGPRLEAVFDSSPPSDLLKQNLVSLQDKLSNGSFGNSNPRNSFIAEEEESLHTPINHRYPRENRLPNDSGHTTKSPFRPEMSSSPQSISSSIGPRSRDRFSFANSQFDESWNQNELEEIGWDDEGLGVTGIQQEVQSFSSPSLPYPRGSRPNIQELHLQEVTIAQDQPKSNIFEWSERNHVDRESQQGSSPRPKTVHGKQSGDRGSRSTGRRAPSALHLRSQSVPLPPDGLPHRGVNSTSKLDAWLLGSKGVSEEWDGDFEFDEPMKSTSHEIKGKTDEKLADSTVITVPQAILERQASVHGQFGQVKELTLLVEELKRLRHQASAQGITGGQSAELWKEAEGIINLATLDDEDQEWLVPRSPHSPGFEIDPFEEDSPGNHRRQRSGLSQSKDGLPAKNDHTAVASHVSLHSSPSGSKLETPPHGRPRKESVARAKSVLEHIHQHRNNLDPSLAEVRTTQKKLPFDTTSLRDLVTRAGVVTRALKEIVRKANNEPETPERYSSTPPDPPFSHMFHPPANPTSVNRSPRGGNNAGSTNYLGGSITGNDNEINGHMKMMTVV